MDLSKSWAFSICCPTLVFTLFFNFTNVPDLKKEKENQKGKVAHPFVQGFLPVPVKFLYMLTVLQFT